jgi:hypothetical protein
MPRGVINVKGSAPGYNTISPVEIGPPGVWTSIITSV